MANETELVVEDLGAQGDGIARSDGANVFIPFALPGERVLAVVEGERGKLRHVLSRSADRTEPVCRHFGACGGCALQHFQQSRYLDWKCERVRAAFAARGLTPSVEPAVQIDLRSRRRAILAARLEGGEIVLGFHGARSHGVIDVNECPVLAPELVKLLPALRECLRHLFLGNEELRVNLLAAENGIDVAVSGTLKNLSSRVLSETSALAANLPIVRLTINSELAYGSASPRVAFGSAHIEPPPGVFLQASKLAEQTIAKLVVGALPKRVKEVADLFCGLGALTFPLAKHARVSAFDNDVSAVDALRAGWRKFQGFKRVDAKVRNLFQEPLSRKELEPFDFVVFDPPRAGARAQAEALAKSKVPVVVAVSCNPATLARDSRILVDGGYSLTRVTPIDQFVYSAHIEAVAVFRR